MQEPCVERFTTPLDSVLLAQPFEVQTNWVAFTGSSCCGKTTMIHQLAEMGYHTLHEVARDYFDAEVTKGKKIEDIRSNMVALQNTILRLQQEMESKLRPNNLVFLDRAIPDCLSFFRYAGINPNKSIRACFHYKYGAVYVFDLLPMERDGVRIEGDEMRLFLDTWIPRDYQALGYDVVRVPVRSREDRLVFVLEDLKNKGLI